MAWRGCLRQSRGRRDGEATAVLARRPRHLLTGAIVDGYAREHAILRRRHELARVVRAPASTQRCIGWERAAVCACVRVRERALLCAHHATCFAAGPIALNRLASASAARSQISTLFSSSDTVIAIELGSCGFHAIALMVRLEPVRIFSRRGVSEMS